MEPDPNLEPRVAQTRDSSDQLDRRMAGERRMVVVSDRRAKYRGEPIAELLADDAAKLAYGASHRDQGRLQARDGRFGVQIRDEPRRVDHVGAKDRHKSLFAIGVHALSYSSTAFGAPIVVRSDRRLACKAKHSPALKGYCGIAGSPGEQPRVEITHRDMLINPDVQPARIRANPGSC
ncbi:hypothetical protein JCM18382A_70080 [Bradyrhizobium sp. 17-4]